MIAPTTIKQRYVGLALLLALTGPLAAKAQTLRPSGLGGAERLTDRQLQAREQTASLLQTAAAIESYQVRLGKLGQIMGQTFVVKRLGASLANDQERLEPRLQDALNQADLDTEQQAPAADPVALTDLIKTPNSRFDNAYLDDLIATTQQNLADLKAYPAADMEAPVRDVVGDLVASLDHRLTQAQQLRSELR